MSLEKYGSRFPDIQILTSTVDIDRQKQANVACENMVARGMADKHTLNWLLYEHRETECALKALAWEPMDPIGKLPNINQFLPPTIKEEPPADRDKPLLIEVVGPPFSEKTTLVYGAIRFSSPRFYPALEQVQYAKGTKLKIENFHNLYIPWWSKVFLKRKLQQDEEFEFEMKKVLLNFRQLDVMNDMANGVYRKVPIVADKWFLDQRIFLRSRFMQGKSSEYAWKRLANPNDNLDSMFRRGYGNFNYAVINCLTDSNTALARAGKKRGHTVNEEDLPSIVEQYIRAHYELISRPRSFPYICIDTSRKDFGGNQSVFREAVGQIYRHFQVE